MSGEVQDTVEFRILTIDSSEYDEYLALRNEVLRKPLGLEFTPEEMLREPSCIHIAGYLANNLCMTLALVPEGAKLKMIQVATKPGLERRGIGSAALAFCERYCLERGIREIYCHARETAIPFYLRSGYVTEGENYILVGIPHVTMRKRF